MRTTVGILGAITMLFVGVIGLSMAADRTKQTAYNATNTSADAWNMTTGIIDGAGQALAPGLVWMGIGAIILVVCGFLYMAVPGGGR